MSSISRVKVPSEWFEEEPAFVEELRGAGYDVVGDEVSEEEVEFSIEDELALSDLLCEPGPAESIPSSELWSDT